MYKDQADAADPDFFEIQREDLCNWHQADPVDQLEWERSKMIAQWQDDRSNPFVLDCTLAFRLYCGDVSDACITVDVSESALGQEIQLLNNPVTDRVYFESTTDQQLESYSIISMATGQRVQSGSIHRRLFAQERFELELEFSEEGSYIVQWLLKNPSTGQQQVVPFKIVKFK